MKKGIYRSEEDLEKYAHGEMIRKLVLNVLIVKYLVHINICIKLKMMCIKRGIRKCYGKW